MKFFIIVLGLTLALSAFPEALNAALPEMATEAGTSRPVTAAPLTATSIRSKGDALKQIAIEMWQAGIQLPLDIYPAIASSSQARDSDGQAFLSKLADKLDGYSQELNILRNSPGQLGTVELMVPQSLRAGERIEARQVYTVGTPLEIGTGILVAKHWQHDIHLQAFDQNVENFVSVKSSNPDVVFKSSSIRRSGTHGSRFGLAELLFFEIVTGNLLQGDTITISYGAGRLKFKLPEIVSSHITLPLYLRVKPMGPFFTIPVQEFEVVAGHSARLVVLAPSILKNHQRFNLTIRAEDRFGNLASGPTPQLEVIVDGVFQQRVLLPETNVLLVEDLKFDSEGLHEITVRTGGGGLTGRSNPILVDDNLNLEIAWVNLHEHSNESDAIQSPDEIRHQTTGLYDLNLVVDHDDYFPEYNPFSLESFDKPRVVSLPLSRGGHHLVIPASQLRGTKRLVVALPEIPPDHRGLIDPILVEIHSGSSSHEWLGQYFSSLGYRVGYSASRTSHLPVRNLDRGQTAILLTKDEEPGTAIHARRTYASTGPRSILLVDVNGGLPGSRVPRQDRRKIQGRVYATSAIDRVELIRNGEVINRYTPPVDESSLRIRVTLGSDSKPIAPGWDLPRNGREWLGYIRILGAKISAISAPGFKNRKRSAISLNPAESARVDFITWTHGSESSFVLTLQELPGEEISLELNIKKGFEDVDLMPAYRGPSETPSSHQLITLADIIDGGVVRLINVNGYDDYVQIELANTVNLSKVSFSFTDTRKMGVDDFYYIKVKQADDHTLWSSPVHVGGFDLE